MKKLFRVLIFTFGIGASPFLNAQSDIKLNVSNAIIYELNVMYEYTLSDNMSISAFGGYVYGLPEIEETVKYLYIGAEFRYYVSPKLGADGFYFGGYTRYKNGYSKGHIEESGILLDGGGYNYNEQKLDVDFNKLAFGFSLGSKWVTRSGFVFGFFGGLGRNLYADYKESSDYSSREHLYVPGTYQANVVKSSLDSRYWDWRMGFNIGFRIQ